HAMVSPPNATRPALSLPCRLPAESILIIQTLYADAITASPLVARLLLVNWGSAAQQTPLYAPVAASHPTTAPDRRGCAGRPVCDRACDARRLQPSLRAVSRLRPDRKIPLRSRELACYRTHVAGPDRLL